LQPGLKQFAAGYVLYGAQTQLVLTTGDGTVVFTLDPTRGEYIKTGNLEIGRQSAEFAINMSNYRHWDDGVRNYIDDCLKGVEGPLGKNYNMRWLAAVMAEAHRILHRGGIFIYPPDKRESYGKGRLRLVYEANPIAFLIEQAGGHATDGLNRILELVPHSPHQRTGLVFGSTEEVTRLGGYLSRGADSTSPLFGQRGLFRG
jgi:fructose-1,6-bisphosphatase I